MKTLTILFVFLVTLISVGNLAAQVQQDSTKVILHVVVKNDGTEFIGRILSQDAREVLIDTKEVGQVIVPKHEIKEIRELTATDFTVTGVYVPEEVFATRYFITTNGLPIKKGESYILWNWYGPDMQFGVGKNFGIGIMTTWIAVPIIASAKYSIRLAEKSNLGLGLLLGTGSWSVPDFKLALPFAAMTFGDRKASISFSGGYGSVTHMQQQFNTTTYQYSEKKVNEHRALLSVACMFKVGRKISFVFDSIIVPAGPDYWTTGVNYNWDQTTGQQLPNTTYQYKQTRPGFSMFIPGIRWQVESDKAFQFGFAAIKATDGTAIPIPMIQWFRKI